MRAEDGRSYPFTAGVGKGESNHHSRALPFRYCGGPTRAGLPSGDLPAVLHPASRAAQFTL